jgi:dTDP-4-amino-4,6-dideoxygalactose transaminase
MATTEQPAIAGGAPAIEAGAHRRWPEITQADREAVLRVLESGVLCGANAPEITALQREWAEYVGVEHCLALNTGTAALHCACAAVGLGPGDEVIVPAFTFVATAMAVMHQGATPVFCDVDPRTYNLDPARLEERITERTRAIMPVHLHGLPADMDEIRAVAARHRLAVIEDAAQSHGATYRGVKTGALADCAGFSLNATKNLSGGEGGLFVTDDATQIAVARRLSVFGEDVNPTVVGEFRRYWTHGVGWNYRNQELSSALARSQLRRLDEYNGVARANAETLSEGLERLPGILPPHVPDDRTSVFHKYRVRFDAGVLRWNGDAAELRDRLVRALRAEGVEACLWQVVPLPAYPAFRREPRPWRAEDAGEELGPWDRAEHPAATELLEQSLVLGSESQPLFVQDRELMKRYVEAFEKVLANLEAIAELPFDPVALVD